MVTETLPLERLNQKANKHCLKLLVLDKDGTLVTPASGDRFVSGPMDQKLLPGARESLKKYWDEGWVIAIASNQGGIEYGHKTEADTVAEMNYAMHLTRSQSGRCIDRAIFAPSYEKDGVGKAIALAYKKGGMTRITSRSQKYRKGAPGMLIWLKEEIIKEQLGNVREADIDCTLLFVGDREEDQEAAANAGFQFKPAQVWRTEAFMKGVEGCQETAPDLSIDSGMDAQAVGIWKFD